jgi:hypothetical protein
VFFNEEAIMRDQKMELIYLKSDMLYEIIPETPRSTFDLTKPNSIPHADGIVGSSQSKPTYQLSNQMQQLSLQQTMARKNSITASPATHMSKVNTVKMKKPKDKQQFEGKRN